jgi:hypothetical protein
MPMRGGDGTIMLFRVRRHRSILLTFKKLMIGKLGRPILKDRPNSDIVDIARADRLRGKAAFLPR